MNEEALIAAERAYRENIETRPMRHAIEAYEAARGPRTITREELEGVAKGFSGAPFPSARSITKARSALATIGITVEEVCGKE